MKFITLSATPDADEVRVDRLYGRTHLVAPVVMVREGVLKGGYVPSDEIAYSENGWNGRPITAPPEKGTNARAAMPDDLPDGMSGHPLNGEGDFVSANQDPYADDMRIGEVRQVETIEENAALRAEAWLDIERVKTVGTHAQSVIESLVNGDPLDVSIGFWHDIEQSAGTFNESEYEFVVRNIMPDHLAMLPNETGACSWDDGCGVPRAQNATALTEIEAVADVDCGTRASMLGANQDPPDDAELEQEAMSFVQRLAQKFGWTDPQHQTRHMTDPDIDIETLSEETGIEPDTLESMSEEELTSLNERVIEADADDDGTGDGSTDDGGDSPPEYVEQFSQRLNDIEEQIQEQQSADLSDEIELIAESTDYDKETIETWPEEAVTAMAETVRPDEGEYRGQGVNRLGQVGAPTEEGEDSTDDIGPVGAMTAMQAQEGGD